MKSKQIIFISSRDEKQTLFGLILFDFVCFVSRKTLCDQGFKQLLFPNFP
jgi:hypothetical protein